MTQSKRLQYKSRPGEFYHMFGTEGALGSPPGRALR
jgi:hypothetical protein